MAGDAKMQEEGPVEENTRRPELDVSCFLYKDKKL